MRRGFTIWISPAHRGESFGDRVKAAIAEINAILEANDRDDCVAVLNRGEGRLYAAAPEEILMKIGQLPKVSRVGEDEYDGYRVAMDDDIDERTGRQRLSALFNRDGSGEIRDFSRAGGLPVFIVGGDDTLAEKIGKLPGVIYAMPNYGGRAGPIGLG